MSEFGDNKVELERHTDSCKRLSRGLMHAIWDLEFPGQLHYAIDFSEIFAYIFPSESYQHFLLFSDDPEDPESITSAKVLQQLMLKHLFLDSQDKLILLPPYALEFEAVFARLRESNFDQLVSRAVELFGDAERMLSSPDSNLEEITNIVDRLSSVGDSPEPLSSREREMLLNFVQQYAHIEALLTEDVHKRLPLARVRELFEQDVFDDLNAIVTIDSGPEIKVFQRWYSKLRKRPKSAPASSRIDAAAIELIYQANQSLPDDSKLLLVTRSEFMHHIFDIEFEGKQWSDTGSYHLLRHPLSFCILAIFAHRPHDEVLQTLNDQLTTINLFLESAKEVSRDVSERTVTGDDTFQEIGDGSETEHYLCERLEEHFKQIQGDWRKMQALAHSLAASQAKTEMAGDELSPARRIFRLLRNDKELRELIILRLDELINDVSRAHELLGLHIHLSDERRELVRAEKYAEKLVLKTTSQAMPYTLQFRSEEIRELVGVIEPDVGIRWVDLIDFFRKGFSKESDYERLLAMAYVLGVISRWHTAEQYCEYSIDLACRRNLPTYEGFFFLAVCKRKLADDDLDRQMEALELLDQALANKSETICQWDPRYLKEKGTLILRIHILDYGDEVANYDIPSLREGLRLLDEAEENLGDDERLRLQIINNRLYYYLHDATTRQVIGTKEIEKLKGLYNEFLADQKAYFDNEETWPAFIHDTIAWGEWILFYDEVTFDEKRRQGVVDRLERALRSHELTPLERKEIASHLEIVRVGRRVLSEQG